MRRLKVGFVINYNPDKGYGFIRNVNVRSAISQIDEKDIFFHISNTNQKSFKLGDIVGYVPKGIFEETSSDKEFDEFETLDDFLDALLAQPQGKVEATEVKLAKDYTNEFRSSNLAGYKKALVLKGNSTLFWEEMESDLRGKRKLLNNIEEHIQSTDIDLLIKNYRVKVQSGGAFRARKSEPAWVNISSQWNEIDESSPLYDNSIHATCYHYADEKYRNDIYIKDLLPDINIPIFREKNFCSWQKTIRRYKQDQKNWAQLEERASKKEAEIKKTAKNKYDKNDHKEVLRNFLKNEVNKIEKEHNLKINKTINKYWSYNEHI